MKKYTKSLIYIGSAVILFVCIVLVELLFDKSIDWTGAIIMTALFTVVDVLGTKKYIENKTGQKLTKKQNINHFIGIILAMIIALFGYYVIKDIIDVNTKPNDLLIEMSVKKSLINIATEKYENENDYIYAESHKVLDYEVKNNKIYVYIVANYGILDKSNCETIKDTKNTFTLIYSKEKNKNGIYELKEYKENSIPSKLENKSKVNFDNNYYKSQLTNYCN